jgi:hypothetical protein
MTQSAGGRDLPLTLPFARTVCSLVIELDMGGFAPDNRPMALETPEPTSRLQCNENLATRLHANRHRKAA